jgi:hypothetical protein
MGSPVLLPGQTGRDRMLWAGREAMLLLITILLLPLCLLLIVVLHG